MSARKSERLLNLLIALLVARGYVTKDRLRQVIEDYRTASSTDAFEKMFERDKEDLRAIGIPIEVGGFDPLFDDEPGYRIVRSTFELPPVALEADEAAVIGLAARVWEHAGLAAATSEAVLKLKAAGLDVDRAALDVALPRLAADEPSFEAFWEAVSTRSPVRFSYRGSSSPTEAVRHLQPWGIVSYRSRWYAVGFDTDRQDVRMFRLSRVVGEVTTTGRPASYDVPEDLDLRSLAGSLGPDVSERTARVRVRAGRAVSLRRRATSVEAGDGWDLLEVGFGRADALVDELLAHGPDVVVEAPADVRSAVVDRLTAVAGAGR